MKHYLFIVVCLMFAWPAAAQSQPQDTKQPASSSVVVYDGAVRQLAVAPTFKKKGFEKYQQWIFAHVEYPIALKPSRVQGTVLMKVIVETDGSVSVGEVLQSPAPDLTDVVKQAVHASPRWTPGMMRDEQSGELYPVRVAYRLSIDFKFQEDTELGGGVTGRWQVNKNLKPYGSNN